MDRNRSSNSSRTGGLPVVSCGFVVAAVVVVVAIFAFFTIWEPVGRQEVGLVYGGGPIDPKVNQFKKTVGPGGRHNVGWMNKVIKYPTTVRNWIVAPEGQSADVNDPVEVATKPEPVKGEAAGVSSTGTVVPVTGKFSYRLNWGTRVGDTTTIDETKLRLFHENYGLKKYGKQFGYENIDGDSTEDGWYQLLLQEFWRHAGPAMAGAGRNMTYSGFQTNGDAKTPNTIKWYEAEVGKDLSQRIKDTMGENFFCGPNLTGCQAIQFTMTPLQPNEAISQAGERIEVARRNAEAAGVEARAIKKAQENGLSGMAYVINECRKAPGTCPNMTIIVSDGQTPVAATVR
jgi:hypothetical protein